EMKMMETTLLGAARQAEAKADEIAKLMNEIEQLKSITEDQRRKPNEAGEHGEGLSKKQATQESLIKKLRAQIREFEEEKKGLMAKLQEAEELAEARVHTEA
ncbi:hypothetical protein Tco_1171768, partial [Tanacetum coccineum]